MTVNIKQSTTTYPLVFLMVDSTDHVTGKTGLTPTVTFSKAGAAFGAAAGAVTEIANGWYQCAGNATDNNTLGPLILHATGTGADPTDKEYNVTARLIDDLASQASVDVIDDFLDTEVAAIKAVTDRLDTTLEAAGGSPGDYRFSADALTHVPTSMENADALLNRDMSAVSDTNSRSPLNALRHIRNKWETTSAPGFVVVRKEDDTTEAWRAALSSSAGAEPITGSDPT